MKEQDILEKISRQGDDTLQARKSKEYRYSALEAVSFLCSSCLYITSLLSRLTVLHQEVYPLVALSVRIYQW